MEIKINERKYFLFFHKNIEQITCILCDSTESWVESSTLANVLERGKESNKRIKYDEATILDTLQNTTPVSVNWVEENQNCGQNERYLKLKYSVESHPFHFTWHFKRQTENEFQKYVMCIQHTLFEGLSKQNEELREIIIKKDIEIKQFKTEGAILKRVTVATKPFNRRAFDEKYKETIELSKSAGKMAELILSSEKLGNNLSKQTETKDTYPPLGKNNESNNVRISPRKKRRKMLDEQQRIIAEKLKARGKALEYESSQSESLTTNSPDVLDVDTPKNPITLEKEQYDHDKIKERNDMSPSKCPRAQKTCIENKSEEKPSLRKRKSMDYVEYDSSQSSTEEEGEQIPATNEKTVNTSIVHSKSPLNTTNDDSIDIQRIIDEWKELEQRRVADMNNMRTTRAGRRLNY